MTLECPLCSGSIRQSHSIPVDVLPAAFLDLVRKQADVPLYKQSLCFNCVDQVYQNYQRQTLVQNRKDIVTLQSLAEKGKVEWVKQVENYLAPETNLTLSQKLADKMTSFGGSWNFILYFCLFLISWICLNVYLQTFDPPPFIGLNMMLSCFAALQASIILMSQNRQAAKDRKHAEEDMRTQIKARIELDLIHEKIDHMLKFQWSRQMEHSHLIFELMQRVAKEQSNLTTHVTQPLPPMNDSSLH